MEVIELLVNTVRGLDYKIILQGTMSEDEKYPDEGFFTYYWGNDDSHFVNNKNLFINWEFDLSYYTKDTEDLFTSHKKVRDELIKLGFTIDSKPSLVLSDEPEYIGGVVRVKYREIGGFKNE